MPNLGLVIFVGDVSLLVHFSLKNLTLSLGKRLACLVTTGGARKGTYWTLAPVYLSGPSTPKLECLFKARSRLVLGPRALTLIFGVFLVVLRRMNINCQNLGLSVAAPKSLKFCTMR